MGWKRDAALECLLEIGGDLGWIPRIEHPDPFTPNAREGINILLKLEPDPICKDYSRKEKKQKGNKKKRKRKKENKSSFSLRIVRIQEQGPCLSTTLV